MIILCMVKPLSKGQAMRHKQYLKKFNEENKSINDAIEKYNLDSMV